MIKDRYPYFLAGRPVTSDQELEVTNKYTGDVVSRVSLADEAAIDQQCLEPLCSFCGKSVLNVERMVEGKNAQICEACIRVLAGSLDGER